ncbi:MULTISPECIES: beta-N-acetylhexosaminidase [unclassified Streptomyces]|uniref:beta-N-acetylhexosaminidase n=1 Tax=unclassified Streptomyces TaxID=2593676 RepID=UPI00037C53A5|nr:MULTISPECIES: beta-N-acetylhexosaminidase [unclassified Streptomyces]MYY03628.1 family 20 glycosylhydrolase [Streptomyces sp. SID4913]
MPEPRPEHSLVPRPLKVSSRPGRFTFAPDTAIRASPGAESAAGLLRTLLAPTTGLPLAPSATGRIVLALDPELSGLGEEGYGLTIGPDTVLLRAARPAGLLCGVQTLRQLLPAETLSGAGRRNGPWTLPCVEISDVPAHAWRGTMLDVARHFQPVSYLRRYVDLMALHKLNTLHLHLTDDQGWRMPVAAYPKLTGIGGHRSQSMAGPPGGVPETFDGVPHSGAYTRQELRDLVRYAGARGVRVVPEIEMPGHVRAALAAHPELGNDPSRRLGVWTRWGICDTVLGVHEEVFDFCRTVLGEVMDVFPSPYIHVGGDECPTSEWENSPAARRRAAAEGLAGARALHGWFMGRIGAFVTERGRTPVGWAETGTELPLDFTVMTWRDPSHARTAAVRGHQVVAAHYRATYLDYAESADPGEPPAQPGPPVGLRAVHGDRSLAEGWDRAVAGRLLGTQAQLWTEYASTPDRIEYRTYPRLCALADRAWSGTRADWPGFLTRLGPHLARLDALGVRYRPLNPRPLTAASPGTAPTQ